MQEKIDILNRQPIVDRLVELIRLLADSGRGCTFSLDGKWGTGKTFVLEMLEKQLSLFQDPNAAGDRYVLFHYNCWQYDFCEEPAIAIVAAIKNEVSKYNRLLPELPSTVQAALTTVKDIGKELLGGFLENKIGCNPISLIDDLRANKDKAEEETANANKFDTYYSFKEALDLTKTQLEKIATDKPVILVVDELDRCMPDYAIKILERLHHLFDTNSNIIILLAVDGAQLNRIIRKIYGMEHSDEDRRICDDYLKKFIDFSISLDSGEISKNFWEQFPYILSNYDVSDDPSEMYVELPCNLFRNVDIRTQERCMDKIFMWLSL